MPLLPHDKKNFLFDIKESFYSSLFNKPTRMMLLEDEFDLTIDDNLFGQHCYRIQAISDQSLFNLNSERYIFNKNI